MLLLAVMLSCALQPLTAAADTGVVVVADPEPAQEAAHRHVVSAEPTEDEVYDPSIPEFVPTAEFRDVLPGQRIPPGLHVEIDFQTGKRRAKLLDPADRVGKPTLSEKRRTKLNIVADELSRRHQAEAEAEAEAEAHSHPAGTDGGASSATNSSAEYTEGQQRVRDMQDTMAANREQWTPPEQPESGTDFRAILAELATAEPVRQLELLLKIEHAVHEGETAREFVNDYNRGMQHLLPLLDGATTHTDAVEAAEGGGGKPVTDDERAAVAAAAAGVLGIAAQNNMEVQAAVDAIVQPSAIDRLMALLVSDQAGINLADLGEHQRPRPWVARVGSAALLKMRRRALFALGVLLRPSLLRQDVFLTNGGAELLLQLAAQQDRSMARKALTLLSDMLYDTAAEQRVRIHGATAATLAAAAQAGADTSGQQLDALAPLPSLRAQAVKELGGVSESVPLHLRLRQLKVGSQVAEYASADAASGDDLLVSMELLTLLNDKGAQWPSALRQRFVAAVQANLPDWESEAAADAEDEYYRSLALLGRHLLEQLGDAAGASHDEL